jgi:hypothetical protein
LVKGTENCGNKKSSTSSDAKWLADTTIPFCAKPVAPHKIDRK